MNNADCDKIYSDAVNMTGDSNYILFKLAQCFMSGYDLDNLRQMLLSDDDGVVLDALFVCKEIGRLVCQVSDNINPLRSSHDDELRKMANEVAKICEIYACEGASE